MTRIRYTLAAVFVVVAALGCDRTREDAGEARTKLAVPTTPGLAPSPAPADAARPNEVLEPAQFADPRRRAAYAAARQYAHVLERIYCYCRCKENLGHRALVECFETDHATECDICQTEALVAARMAAEGRSVAEIQQAIDAYYTGRG